MFQPLKERILILELGQRIQIDEMDFFIRRIHVDWEESDFSISIWGSSPNATSFHFSRVIKYEDYVWRPEKYGISFSTSDKKHFNAMSFEKNELAEFIECQNKGEEEIVNCWIKLTTMINEPRYYDFK